MGELALRVRARESWPSHSSVMTRHGGDAFLLCPLTPVAVGRTGPEVMRAGALPLSLTGYREQPRT